MGKRPERPRAFARRREPKLHGSSHVGQILHAVTIGWRGGAPEVVKFFASRSGIPLNVYRAPGILPRARAPWRAPCYDRTAPVQMRRASWARETYAELWAAWCCWGRWSWPAAEAEGRAGLQPRPLLRPRRP